MAFFLCELPPIERFLIILFHPQPFRIHKADVDVGIGISLLGGLLKTLNCRRMTLFAAFAAVIKDTQNEIGVGNN
ncbi:MAG: hypothetical protein ACD_75C00892G0001, partial [uncultured bacterium]